MAFLQIFVSQQLLFLFSKHLDTMSNVTDCGAGRTDLCLMVVVAFCSVVGTDKLCLVLAVLEDTAAPVSLPMDFNAAI